MELCNRFANFRVVHMQSQRRTQVLWVTRRALVAPIGNIYQRTMALFTYTSRRVRRMDHRPMLFIAIFVPRHGTTIVALRLRRAKGTSVSQYATFLVAITFSTRHLRLNYINVG